MDFSTNKPIYLQIADYCINGIVSGRWLQDEKMPSIRALAVEFAVNTHTVLKAYEELEARGLIHTRRGLGYFISQDAQDVAAEIRRREFHDTTMPDFFTAMDALGITMDEVVKCYLTEWQAKR